MTFLYPDIMYEVAFSNAFSAICFNFFVHKVLVLHIAILTQYRNIPIYFGGEMSTIEATLARQRQLVEFLALLQQHFEFSAQTSKLNLTRSNSFSAAHISREREIERELKENIQIIPLQPHHSEWDVSDKPNHIENPIQINSLRIS